MTTDRLFVIMLVMLIPMTGCFGALDNADAEENTSETIVNNYYNNTTTIVDTPVIEKFTAGGMIDYNSDDYEDLDYAHRFSPYNFSTNAGEMVTIHYFMYDGWVDQEWVRTVCDDGTTGVTTNGNSLDRNVWGSHDNCVHTVQLTTISASSNAEKYESGEYTMAWSLVYSIESVTVV